MIRFSPALRRSLTFCLMVALFPFLGFGVLSGTACEYYGRAGVKAVAAAHSGHDAGGREELLRLRCHAPVLAPAERSAFERIPSPVSAHWAVPPAERFVSFITLPRKRPPRRRCFPACPGRP
ncbi:hypothetical protein [Azoarcus olearius]|uniref:hypothetical protein n=1 Tax=Azoarcus sp. (strain BH72) TaxID=418699 RepID=UPI0011D1BA78|nr:hypothetical protein [Azoarcus olearius]